HVDFTPTDAANYSSTQKNAHNNVTRVTSVRTLSHPAEIAYPTLLSATQLNATADVAGALAYSPASGTKLNAGNGQTLHVDFTPKIGRESCRDREEGSNDAGKGTPDNIRCNP